MIGKSKQGDDFRVCEKLLYNYKYIDNDIEGYQNTIDYLKESDYSATLQAMQYDKDIISATNKFSSSVENAVIERDKVISYYEQKIKNLEYIKRKINIALKRLTPEEYKLIELRYFSKEPLTWVQIGNLMNFCKDNCMLFRNKTINKLIPYLVDCKQLFSEVLANL